MSSIDAPLPPPSLRPLPPWVWALTALMFPAAVFVALGCARALSWARALVLAVLSAGSTIGYVQLMVYLESHESNRWVLGLSNLAGMLVFWAWGFYIYNVGSRTGLWSPVARKLWRALGWGVAGMIMLSILLHLVLALLTLLRAWDS